MLEIATTIVRMECLYDANVNFYCLIFSELQTFIFQLVFTWNVYVLLTVV